ncbi:SIMPL domain-containing protein [Paenibacillus harenae]|uniref:SIMPL domain-containing protein n=1 Tax=Paenibacillus harenae TaxID=306543 RepID=UPI0004018ACC|nr:SIMPL domain-containing protein [Paenibacillus harenae]
MPNQPFEAVPHLERPKCPFTIEVPGEGTAAAAPDRSVVVLGAMTEGPVLQDAQSENADLLNAIIQALLELNIPRENIQTKDFRIEVQYDYVDGKQIFRGYQVTHLLQMTTDQVDQTGLIIDTAVANGANTVTSIEFTTSQPEKYENQALSSAIRSALQKAQTIAGTLGVALSAIPCQVQQVSRTAEPPVLFKAAQLSAGAATPIEPGQLTVHAAVRVWYMFG